MLSDWTGRMDTRRIIIQFVTVIILPHLKVSGQSNKGWPPKCFVCAAGNKTREIIAALLESPSRKNLWRETEKLIAKGLEKVVQ